jgi:hypothetical protein
MTNLGPTSYRWRTTETIPLKVRNETGLSAFSTLTQYRFGIPSRATRQEQQIKGIQTGKEGVKLSLPKRPPKLCQKTIRNHSLLAK